MSAGGGGNDSKTCVFFIVFVWKLGVVFFLKMDNKFLSPPRCFQRLRTDKTKIPAQLQKMYLIMLAAMLYSRNEKETRNNKSRAIEN